MGLLGDDAHDRGKGGVSQVSHVDAVDRHAALVDVVQPRQQVGKGRLSRAGLAHERERRPGRNLEVDVAQRPRAVGPVPEPDALEGDRSGHAVGPQRHRAVALLDLDREVEVVEHALEQGQRALDVHADREQRLDREEEPRLQAS